MIGAIAVAMLLAVPGASGAFDGTCRESSSQPGVSAIGDAVGAALAKTAPVVYRDGGPAGEHTSEEKDRREKAINRAVKVNVPQPGTQIGNGRCAALALEAVMGSFPGKQHSLAEIVGYAKSQGWTHIGELNGPDIVKVAEHYGYHAKSSNGLPSYDSIIASAADKKPLLVGVSGRRSSDPTLSRYPGHMLIVTGAYEVDGVKYVVGKDPNLGGDQAWRYDDLASATNETIAVRPG